MTETGSAMGNQGGILVCQQSLRRNILEFNQAQQQQPRMKETVQKRWKPPGNGLCKVNRDRKVGGFRAIIRDAEGQVMEAHADILPWITDPFSAEATDATHALNFAEEMGFHDIILEVDALTILRNMLQMNQEFSPIRAFTEEARAKAATFKSCTILHVGHSGNEATHRLAKIALGTHAGKYWIEEYPEFLQQIVSNDVVFSDQ
ncbi:uncharacterized protein LOC111274694 [Durio zibethinus]|uniref:Uncharacterized protein LOC111274694 n=1 Tax=Durio zibethinus TaxID=66656 RepID=A0A6P5WH48_DURZI|nr:uncharacterized protein LOC111274694 [Durio zibethinus]